MKLILKPLATGGELAHEINDSEAEKMLKDGAAIMLHDGIMREVQKPKPKAKAKVTKTKQSTEYDTKQMKPATKKG